MIRERLIDSGVYDLATAYQSMHVKYCNRRALNNIQSSVRG